MEEVRNPAIGDRDCQHDERVSPWRGVAPGQKRLETLPPLPGAAVQARLIAPHTIERNYLLPRAKPLPRLRTLWTNPEKDHAEDERDGTVEEEDPRPGRHAVHFDVSHTVGYEGAGEGAQAIAGIPQADTEGLLGARVEAGDEEDEARRHEGFGGAEKRT